MKHSVLALVLLTACSSDPTQNQEDGGQVTSDADVLAPTATFWFTVNGLEVSFDGSGSTDSDGSIVSYDWEFGDDVSDTGDIPPAHTYAQPGSYTVVLSVTDDDGRTGTHTETIEVDHNAGVVGANLPIEYALSDLEGTLYFVANDGSDANEGSQAKPFASLGKAITKVGSGQSATIVVRGGAYLEGQLQIAANRSIRIIAYPGEVPVFSGAQAMDEGWTSEAALAWHSYTPQPVTDGSGISFTTGQNLTGDGVGKYPDQVWIGTTKLQQVSNKNEVTDAKFWVDAGNNRLYLTVADSAKAQIQASELDRFIRILGANTSLEGLRIMRFSNSANDYGVILVESPADTTLLRHVEVIDPAFISIVYAGDRNAILKGARLENVTIDGPNWMGVGATYVDGLVMESMRIENADPFDEFTSSPQSGAAKISRCRDIKVVNSEILNNKSHGLWFDQSNVGTVLAGNRLDGNTGSAIFYEISDDLLLVNNYVRAPAGASSAVKLSGSSGLKLVNNTIIGGRDPIGIYTDNRSKPGCADPTEPLCAGSYSSDRDSARPLPDTLDWMPRLDLMLNNIVAYPEKGYCGTPVTTCFLASNAGASQSIEAMVHKAEPGRGIPETVIDGNVYANGTGNIIGTENGNYKTTAAWTSAASAPPISIQGIDANGKSGNEYVDEAGAATSSLNHSEAPPIPTDAALNLYISAGTRHFGVLE